jgi:UDP-N-acetylglucosamine acyltransferase
VQVGADVTVGPHVHLLGHVEIGPGCRIHTGAVLGDFPQDLAFTGETSFCRIGARCTIREHVTIHRGTQPGTTTEVGEGCFLMAGSHVAHNCRVADRVILANAVALGGFVEVGTRAFIGGGTVVHQFCRVGECVIAQGGAAVTMDIPPFMMADKFGNVVGINTVGIRRAGFSAEEHAAIKAGHRILYRRFASFREGVEALAQEVKTDAGRRLLAFVQADSKRGIAPRARRGRS